MMKAGKYYIGDLCYVLHDEWNEVCSLTIKPGLNRPLNGEFNLKDGRRFAIYGTAYGDGTYLDEEGRSYNVDSGSIGCIPLDAIDQTNPRNFLAGGRVVEFVQDFDTFGVGGVLRFGTVVIDTAGVEEYC